MQTMEYITQPDTPSQEIKWVFTQKRKRVLGEDDKEPPRFPVASQIALPNPNTHENSRVPHYLGKVIHRLSNELSHSPNKKHPNISRDGPVKLVLYGNQQDNLTHSFQITKAISAKPDNLSLRFPLTESPTDILRSMKRRMCIPPYHADALSPIKTKNVRLEETNRFILKEQPLESQKVSLGSKFGFISPNPLVICLNQAVTDRADILDGSIFVKLINEQGEIIQSHGQLLQHSPGSEFTPLHNCRAHFSIQVTSFDEYQSVKLCFTVSYNLKHRGTVVENIYSRPFAVYSKLRTHK